MSDLVLTIPQCAEQLEISERLVYTLIDEGVIPVVRLGTRKVIPIDALRQMLADRTERSPEASPGIRLAGNHG